ncbi:MAG: DUF1800 domain-containing protein [Janthinobacterium lividum]
MDQAAVIAAIRFGLGSTPGRQTEGERPAADPAQWLQQQLVAPAPAPAPAGSVADAFEALRQDREQRTAPDRPPGQARALFRDETAALLRHAVVTTTPFHERLVWFWANHFTVSIRRGEVAPLVGAYVREAIRPFVTGRFADMLLAVMRHPAMLLYLDNVQSAGPRSPAGTRQQRGLNENLARECLELHTLSPASGYSQADVTEFARILTGWSVERREAPVGFRFRPRLHEPGGKTLLGRTFPEGEQGGVEALRWLAAHPATHRHLAQKLVRHFVADAPPAEAVRRIEGVLRDTDGDLGQAAAALVRLPAAWAPLTKLRSPQDTVVAAIRAAGLAGTAPDVAGLVSGPAAGLGQPVFNAPFPIGWPDMAGDWTGPEAMMRRIDWAYGLANRPDMPEPMQLAENALGPLLSTGTATEIRRAGSRRDGITLLLASPEFQRR